MYWKIITTHITGPFCIFNGILYILSDSSKHEKLPFFKESETNQPILKFVGQRNYPCRTVMFLVLLVSLSVCPSIYLKCDERICMNGFAQDVFFGLRNNRLKFGDGVRSGYMIRIVIWIA